MAVNLEPPQYMRDAAKRGLELHADGLSGDGLRPQTVEDARKMAGGTVTEDKWRRIGPWIARHLVDLDAVQGDEITAGLVAHLLWGSGPSKSDARRAMEYANMVVGQLDEDRDYNDDDNESNVVSDVCPTATHDIEINIANRQKAIDDAAYGPLNPAEANDDFWQAKADRWSITIDEVKTARCGNCAAFDTSPTMIDCIQQGLGTEPDEWLAVEAGDLGYCEVFDFKCASARTCDAWVTIKDEPAQDDNGDEPLGDDMVSTDKVLEARHNHWVVTQNNQRNIAYSNLEMRAEGDSNTLVGYAAVFDSPSEPLPWTEFVRRGSFSKTINDGADVRLLVDHEGVPLARTKSGTLRMTEDDYGLKVEAQLDEANPDAARIMSALRRGDVSQMSFAFEVVKDSWSDDRRTRELKEVKLFDVSVVTYPAYEETMVKLRNASANNTDKDIVRASSLALRRAQLAIQRQRIAVRKPTK